MEKRKRRGVGSVARVGVRVIPKMRCAQRARRRERSVLRP